MNELSIPIKLIRVPIKLSISFDREDGQLYGQLIKLHPWQLPEEDIWHVIVFDRHDWILRSADISGAEAQKLLDKLTAVQSLQDLEELVKGWEY